MRRFLLLLTIVPLVRVVTGCGGGPSFDDFCKAREACYGGNQADTNACVDEQKAEGQVASDQGCSEEFKAAATCLTGISSCHTMDLGVMCKTDADCKAGNSPNIHCQGTCQLKTFGVDATMVMQCEKETNAYQKCRAQ